MNQKSPFDDGRLYDLLFAKFDYGLEFYANIAKQSNGSVLDIACGTGRVLIPCLKAGVAIEGLDLSSNLLDHLRGKANKLGLKPVLYHADMRSFQLNHRYKAIMIPFNSFVHCLTTDEQIRTLTNCYQHLENNGVLAFDTFFPGLGVISGQENVPLLELEEDNPETGLSIRMYDTRSFNRVEQTQSSKIEIQELTLQKEVVQSHLSETKIKWLYKDEMQLLLRLAGFKKWDIFGNFERQPLKLETDAMVVYATK